jgi:hypothetical protein
MGSSSMTITFDMLILSKPIHLDFTTYTYREIADEKTVVARVASRIEQRLTDEPHEFCLSAIETGDNRHHVVVRGSPAGRFQHFIHPFIHRPGNTEETHDQGKPHQRNHDDSTSLVDSTVSFITSHCPTKVEVERTYRQQVHVSFMNMTDHALYARVTVRDKVAFCLQHYDEIFHHELPCPSSGES